MPFEKKRKKEIWEPRKKNFFLVLYLYEFLERTFYLTLITGKKNWQQVALDKRTNGKYPLEMEPEEMKNGMLIHIVGFSPTPVKADESN